MTRSALFAAMFFVAAGCSGPAGPEGPQGDPGPAGDTGDTGATGAMGSTGNMGNMGSMGSMGSMGAPGTSVVAMSLPPGDPDCEFGGSKFVTGDTVTFACNGVRGLQGPQGIAGAPGVAGPAGAQGPAGAAGTNGIDGAIGPAGPVGAPGAAGAAGAQGPQGLQGVPGTDGAAGAQGPAGPAGAQGPAGPAGPAGVAGAAGPAGPAGVGAGLLYATACASTSADCSTPACGAQHIDLGESTPIVVPTDSPSSGNTINKYRACLIPAASGVSGPIYRQLCGWTAPSFSTSSCTPAACAEGHTDLGVSSETRGHAPHNSTQFGFSYRLCVAQ
jgi:hypothetical protein